MRILTDLSSARSFLTLVVLGLLVTGCSGFPYRVDVPQGNVITAEQLETLKTGMTKRQVRFLLGSPMLQDEFHPERWDYIHSTGKAAGERTQKRVTLVFDEDRLIKIDGDMPKPVVQEQPAPATPPANPSS